VLSQLRLLVRRKFAVGSRPAQRCPTVRVDCAAIGRRVAELILARIDGAVLENSVIDIGFEIVDRDTT
jgi:DNA-binding LacI/PurR family transcriptional regulator